MRPRANDRHFAQQYIHQLGELVDIRAPQNTANARHARIVLDRLLEAATIFDRRHRSELKDLDDFIIVPMPGLAEEYGTARIKPDCERNWREHQQCQPCDAYVECTLREPIERRQWRVKHLNGDDSAEVGDLGRRPEVARTYRNDMDRDGKLRQSVRCARDLRQVAWRGQEDDVIRLERAAPVHEFPNVVRKRSDTRNTVAMNMRKRKVTNRPDARLSQIVQDLAIVVGVADDHGPPGLDGTGRNRAADMGMDGPPRNQHRGAGANELKKECSARIPIRDLEHEQQREEQ